MKRQCKEQITYNTRKTVKAAHNYANGSIVTCLSEWTLNTWVSEYYAVKLTGETKKRFIIEK